MPNGSTWAIVDSNVFIYAYDVSEPQKRETAKSLIRELSDSERLVVTVQIVHEFCAVMLRKQRAGLASFGSLRELAEEMMAVAAKVLPLTPAVTLRAIYGHEQHQLSFWDALVWASAREFGIPTIYTEDLHPGVLEGVAIVNPFLAST